MTDETHVGYLHVVTQPAPRWIAWNPRLEGYAFNAAYLSKSAMAAVDLAIRASLRLEVQEPDTGNRKAYHDWVAMIHDGWKVEPVTLTINPNADLV